MHTRLDTCTVVVMYMHKYMLTYVFVFASATWITFLTLWRLLESLARLEVPRRLFKLIKHICTRPKFRVSFDEGKSDFFFQQSGIRQGCPPSAYLFRLVMSVMFADIKSRLNTPSKENQSQQFILVKSFLRMMHIFSGSTPLLWEQIAERNRTGVSVLQHEFESPKMHQQKKSTTKYQSGNAVPRRQQAVYLGSLLTDTVNHAAEIQKRLSMAIKTCAQLKLFRNRANTSISWKLRRPCSPAEPS